MCEATSPTDDQSPIEPWIDSIAGGNLALVSVRSPAKETPNEDALESIDLGDGSLLLVVADGCGGHAGGARASALVIDTLSEEVRRAEQSQRAERETILRALDRANEKIHKIGIGAATTVALAEIHDHTVRTYHAGDSSIVITGQRGAVKLQTIAHAPIAYAVESGMIGENEAMHHEDRSLVSNALGSPEMRIEMSSPLTLSRRDTLMLATDGVTDNLFTEEIVEIIRKGSIDEAARRLAATCVQRMCERRPELPSHPDDCTFILYRRAE